MSKEKAAGEPVGAVGRTGTKRGVPAANGRASEGKAPNEGRRSRGGADRLVRGADGRKSRTGGTIQLARYRDGGEAIKGDQLGVP